MPGTAQEQDLGQDHYSVLSLPSPFAHDRAPPTPQQIKQAYHKALLVHHPDKLSKKLGPTPSATPKSHLHTIDSLRLAYEILSDPNSRSAYDRKLSLISPDSTLLQNGTSSEAHPGIETLDLDDMGYDEVQKEFYRSCRCGRERGYTVTERQLEEHEEEGEILIGCQGCSLWLRVGFAVAVE